MGLLDCTPLVIVLLMTLCLTVTPSGGQTNNTLSSDGTIVWGKLAPDKPYQTATYQADDGGLDPYYNLARSFIDSSLPEYLPLGECQIIHNVVRSCVSPDWTVQPLVLIG